MKQYLWGMIMVIMVNQVMAEVYSCGPGCYTSSASRGHSRADLGRKIGSYTSAPTPHIEVTQQNVTEKPTPQVVTRRTPVVASARSVPVANAVPATPKVSAAKASGRRTILEEELSNERNALAAAQKALAAGRAVEVGRSDVNHQARIRQLESAVLDRQQNIQALQRELGRM